MPLIRISEYVKERLEKIKRRNGHTSIDSVIRYLLSLEEVNEMWRKAEKAMHLNSLKTGGLKDERRN